jgi:Domain of unknown function (DUF4956)
MRWAGSVLKVNNGQHPGDKMTNIGAALAADIAAITLLAYVVYYRRYFSRDLVLAYVALNVGVLSVTTLLSMTAASVGLGLGLFGILSIIRLRSNSIAALEKLLGAKVLHVVVQELDMVRDLTVVDVRFRVNAAQERATESLDADVPQHRDEILAIAG